MFEPDGKFIKPPMALYNRRNRLLRSNYEFESFIETREGLEKGRLNSKLEGKHEGKIAPTPKPSDPSGGRIVKISNLPYGTT
jgi:hypothetical protein